MQSTSRPVDGYGTGRGTLPRQHLQDQPRIRPRLGAETLRALTDPNLRAIMTGADVHDFTVDERAVVGGGAPRPYTTVPRIANPAYNDAYARIAMLQESFVAGNPALPSRNIWAQGPAITERGNVSTGSAGTSMAVRPGPADVMSAPLSSFKETTGESTFLSAERGKRAVARRNAVSDRKHAASILAAQGLAAAYTPAAAVNATAGGKVQSQPWESIAHGYGQYAATAMNPSLSERGGTPHQVLPGPQASFLATWKSAILGDSPSDGAKGTTAPCPDTPLRITFWTLSVSILFFIGIVVAVAAVKAKEAAAASSGAP